MDTQARRGMDEQARKDAIADWMHYITDAEYRQRMEAHARDVTDGNVTYEEAILETAAINDSQVPDQGRADAMADAETLALSGVVQVFTDSFYVVAAAFHGVRAARAAKDGLLAESLREATNAARATFRAVSGLKGK